MGTLREGLLEIDWHKVINITFHTVLMGVAVWIGQHPELAGYIPVVQFMGQNLNPPRMGS